MNQARWKGVLDIVVGPSDTSAESSKPHAKRVPTNGYTDRRMPPPVCRCHRARDDLRATGRQKGIQRAVIDLMRLTSNRLWTAAEVWA
jgi:hypothetical protein